MITNKKNWAAVALVAGILLIAVNLRLPFTSVAPVASWIQSDFALSTSAIGLLTSLPLFAFAAFSPLSASIARIFGLERTLFGALLLITAGSLIRSSGQVWTLYAGTVLIGVGIALGNVLLPSLIKRDFSANVASMTAAYSIAMGLAGAIGSAVVIHLTLNWGWQVSLAMFVLVPAVALLAWMPQLKKHGTSIQAGASQSTGVQVWRNPLAWQVSLFMGFNAMPFYIAIGWLPTILMNQGISAAQAGSMHGVLQLATAVPGLILAAVIRRMKDQTIAAVVVSLMSAVSFVGLIYAPSFALLWSIALGFGCGASMMLCLAFIGLRTTNAKDAAALSGMAQCVGYLMAAAGPMILGAFRDWLGGWTMPLLIASGIAVLGALMGMLAGRNVHLELTS
ncbi:MFS transporter [Massilia sp. S19_KUP03_FR1]|uniref:MFS transporter n=1 Tax=Massilia sp. S19_KUP03_FR1 TaxID=3025503 RepID=UPI002FCDA5A8